MCIYIDTISGGSDPVGIPSQVWMVWSEKRIKKGHLRMCKAEG